jgi:hypothetical protein
MIDTFLSGFVVIIYVTIQIFLEIFKLFSLYKGSSYALLYPRKLRDY